MELAKEFEPKKIEDSVRSYLTSIPVEKLIFDSENKNQKITFIEGPPTMNGKPHAGHLRGRVFKDLWYRFNTLRGFKIIFNANFNGNYTLLNDSSYWSSYDKPYMFRDITENIKENN